MSYPEQFRYTREHEWVHIQEGIGTIGITDHAQSTLGDIVFVESPKIGAKVEKGSSFGSVESVKAVSDLYAPVSGEVVAVNDELTDTPEKLNTDPHDAWIIRVQMSDLHETDDLLSASDYEKFVSEESGH